MALKKLCNFIKFNYLYVILFDLNQPENLIIMKTFNRFFILLAFVVGYILPH